MAFQGIALCYAAPVFSLAVENFIRPAVTDPSALFDTGELLSYSAVGILLLAPWWLTGRLTPKNALLVVSVGIFLRSFRLAIGQHECIEKAMDFSPFMVYETCSAGILMSFALEFHFIELVDVSRAFEEPEDYIEPNLVVSQTHSFVIAKPFFTSLFVLGGCQNAIQTPYRNGGFVEVGNLSQLT